MGFWGMGDLDHELARIRALRSKPPGLATSDTSRHRVFGAALEQFEQLLRAAADSPPATAPLSLFYALSQAGRAIAAARHRDPARWDYIGHGIGGPERKYPSPIGDAELTPHKKGLGAFRVVSEAVGSPPRIGDSLPLGELWASLPLVTAGEGLGAGLPEPILPRRQTAKDKAPWVFEAPDFPGRLASDALQESYPALADSRIKFVVGKHTSKRGWISAGLFIPLGGPRLDEVAESHLHDDTIYIRPAVGGGPPPSILMTWWAVLFALSQLARYEPAVWVDAISPDNSALTVPIEDGLRAVQRELPQLVYHALTGSWDNS